MPERSAGQQLLDLLGDRPVAYHPALARAFDSVNVAVFLGQILYWTGREADPDGWIWKTRADWTAETALSRHEQDRARRALKTAGILEEFQRGYDRTLGYRVNQEKLLEALAIAPNRQMELPTGGHASAETGPSNCRKPATHDHRVPSENTSETTAETPAAESPPEEPIQHPPNPAWDDLQATARPGRTSPLAPETPACAYLFQNLETNARLAGMKPPRLRFQTAQQRDRFLAAELSLGPAESRTALDYIFGEGFTELRRIVDYFCGMARRRERERQEVGTRPVPETELAPWEKVDLDRDAFLARFGDWAQEQVTQWDQQQRSSSTGTSGTSSNPPSGSGGKPRPPGTAASFGTG